MTKASDIFGSPNYTGSDFYKVWKLREPDERKGETETRMVRRLFGPMKTLLKEGKGRYFQYYRVHYGWEGVNPKDQTKRRARPYLCLFKDDRQTREVLEECEGCDDMDAHAEAAERAERGYQQEGKTEAEVKALMKPHSDWARKFNCDGKYYFCGMDPATDEYGLVLLTPKCKNKLLDAIAEHRKKWPKHDPLRHDQGVLFEFVRKGRGFQIVDDVRIVEEEQKVELKDGTTIERWVPKMAPLTDEQAVKAFEICPDLHPSEQKFIPVLTHEQIQQLVACSGDPEEVDRIFGQGQRAPRPGRRYAPAEGGEEAASEPGDGAANPGEPEPPKDGNKNEKKAEEGNPNERDLGAVDPAPKDREPEGTEDEEERQMKALLAQAEALKAKKAAREASKVEPKVIEAKSRQEAPAKGRRPAPTEEELAGMTKEQFLKYFSDNA